MGYQLSANPESLCVPNHGIIQRIEILWNKTQLSFSSC